MVASPIRVLYVDDNSDLRELIAHLIDSEPDLKCVGTLMDVNELAEHISTLKPDVMLLDLTIPGVDVLQHVSNLSSQLKVIAFTGHTDQNLVRAVLDSGAQGFVFKHDAAEVLLDSIRQVHAGERVVPDA